MTDPQTSLGVAAATPPPPVCSDRGDTERARTRRGGFGQRSDITLIPAPLDLEDPACRERPDLAAAWDMADTQATARSRGYVPPAIVAEAVAVCGGCRHIVACGEHALNVGERIGVWGGLTPSQRTALRRLAGRA